MIRERKNRKIKKMNLKLNSRFMGHFKNRFTHKLIEMFCLRPKCVDSTFSFLGFIRIKNICCFFSRIGKRCREGNKWPVGACLFGHMWTQVVRVNALLRRWKNKQYFRLLRQLHQMHTHIQTPAEIFRLIFLIPLLDKAI